MLVKIRHFHLSDIALGLCVVVTSLWTLWGVGEMFHEGWYHPFEWVFFLIPALISLVLTLLALRWPRVGAALFTFLGVGFGVFTLWRYRPGSGRAAGWTLGRLLSLVPVTLFPIFIGLLFYWGWRVERARGSGEGSGGRRNLRYLVVIGVPLLLGIALAIEPAYRVAHRLDDGYLGERFIQGNGVALHWAPAGPGWQRKGGLSWNELALYGKGRVGFEGKRFGEDGLCNGVGDWEAHCATEEDMRNYNLCLYLNYEGTQLMPTKQGFWRMPTTDEVVRSLTRGGLNAGCTWDASTGRPLCKIKPDKETPLWDPKSMVIYYWTADESDDGRAYYVVYNGAVYALPKFIGMGSRGYRCVRIK